MGSKWGYVLGPWRALDLRLGEERALALLRGEEMMMKMRKRKRRKKLVEGLL